MEALRGECASIKDVLILIHKQIADMRNHFANKIESVT
jgi:hypothetical protein